MTILRLQNKDRIGPVWVDARYSNGFTPFEELIPVEGFPREINFEEIVEINMNGWREVLYRRGLDGYASGRVSDLYRVAIAAGEETCNGYLWPFR